MINKKTNYKTLDWWNPYVPVMLHLYFRMLQGCKTSTESTRPSCSGSRLGGLFQCLFESCVWTRFFPLCRRAPNWISRTCEIQAVYRNKAWQVRHKSFWITDTENTFPLSCLVYVGSQGGGTIPMVNCVYEDHVYEGTIVHVSHDSCEDVLMKIRRIVETKHSSLSTILTIIPRIQQRRNCVGKLLICYVYCSKYF